jgi:peptide alpha-N-acetyltransferase
VQRHKIALWYCSTQYRDESQLPIIMQLIDNELSEPYSIFTYRYFLATWPQLSFIAYDGDKWVWHLSHGWLHVRHCPLLIFYGTSPFRAICNLLPLAHLCRPFGCVVCKMDVHRSQAMRGYVAMLVVDKAYRGKRVGEYHSSVPQYSACVYTLSGSSTVCLVQTKHCGVHFHVSTKI